MVFFCCQGGACKGLEDAGWDVVRAIDIDPQPSYYRPEVFEQGDAVDPRNFWRLMSVHLPRLVWGSPPCQRRTKAQKIQKREHPALIAPFRALVTEWAAMTGGAYVIENVEHGTDQPDDDPLIDPMLLCGTMFPGLRTRRHREFESNVPLAPPSPHIPMREHPPQVKMGRPVREGDWYQAVGNFNGGDGYVKRNMGVPWMTRDGIRECIPPVYAEHVGAQVRTALTTRALLGA